MVLTPKRADVGNQDLLGFTTPSFPDSVIQAVITVDDLGRPATGMAPLVLMPMGTRSGAQITDRFDSQRFRTMIAVLNCRQFGGGRFDLFLEMTDPATGEWVAYVDWANFATGVGVFMAIADPRAVQSDYGVVKAMVKRVTVPVGIRLRLTGTTGSSEYSLSVIMG
jgi:hypothetical protein